VRMMVGNARSSDVREVEIRLTRGIVARMVCVNGWVTDKRMVVARSVGSCGQRMLSG
jgi:hypothetical protein